MKELFFIGPHSAWRENFKPTCLVPAFSEKSVPSESVTSYGGEMGLGTECRAEGSSTQGTQHHQLLGLPVRLCPHWGLHLLTCNVLAPLTPSNVLHLCVFSMWVGQIGAG